MASNKERASATCGCAQLPVGSESVSIIEPVTPVTKKRAKAAPKVYAPHEHFGSPLNICRICGEKYSYVPKPHNPLVTNS